MLVPIGYILIDLSQGVHQSHSLRHLEAPLGRGQHIVVMVVKREMVAQQIIESGVKMTTCHLARVLHLEGSGGRVARIGEERLLVIRTLGVKTLEHLPGHQYLTPDLKLLGPVAREQLERYAAYCLHVGSHVISLSAVATCHRTDQAPVEIREGDRCSVELHLPDYGIILAIEGTVDALSPFIDLLY